jgi:hypothetical protein
LLELATIRARSVAIKREMPIEISDLKKVFTADLIKF